MNTHPSTNETKYGARQDVSRSDVCGKDIRREEAASAAGLDFDRAALIRCALDALPNAYAPYVRFDVAAAVLCDTGNIYTGVNVQIASTPAGICAEGNAITSAVTQGERRIRAIAIVGGKNGVISSYCPPCGICRQTMREFADPDDLVVILAKSEDDYLEKKLSDLLPMSFGPEDLGEE